MFDGKGKINVYTCEKCGGKTVTIDVDTGVTPFMLRCRANGHEDKDDPETCSGMAVSACYRVGAGWIPKWEWYKPTEQEAKEIDAKMPGMYQHYAQGGLFLRPRAAA